MRWVNKIFRACSTLWFTLRLGVLLTSFLIWFGVQRYLLGRVFLVSFFWFCLALLLLLNQLILWHSPNVFEPQLAETLPVTAAQEEQLGWRLVNQAQLQSLCEKIYQVADRFPTHQSLHRNVALCQLTQQQAVSAQATWKNAQALQPNQ